MIRYPFLKKNATIGVTAPSSGVGIQNAELLTLTSSRLKSQGFNVIIGETAWKQDKAKSAPANVRGHEFNEMIKDDGIDVLIPPWGGELLIEALEFIDFDALQDKWIVGYSDISVLLLAVTLTTGLATAHGANLIDLRGEYSDDTTALWHAVLETPVGESIVQHSSLKYQREWQHDVPSPCVFHLTEETYWKSLTTDDVTMKGRLLGGCIDVIRHLIGTPYGKLQHFQQEMIHDEPIVWYLENCELNTADLRRSLVQMKLAGWFENCSGIMFGRSPANRPVDNYTAEDIYAELFEELKVPIVYDIDCGHVPPQVTFINGAYAEIEVADGVGTVKQYFYE
ncbi:S66 peptidase family protein [Paenibacillus sp. FSL H7-0943]|uniref:S66 family peptidase n=1 Tax=Paenibacillus sp. FSL H7-0943 TaxID=2954739 RepID=UPI0030D258EA